MYGAVTDVSWATYQTVDGSPTTVLRILLSTTIRIIENFQSNTDSCTTPSYAFYGLADMLHGTCHASNIANIGQEENTTQP